MRQIKITPTCIKTGNTAPSFYVMADPNERPSKIDTMAREQSGLGRFENWVFYT